MLKKLTDYIYKLTGAAINFQSIVDQAEIRSIVVYLLIKLGQADGDFAPQEANRIIEMIQREGRLRGEEAIKIYNASFKQHQGKSVPAMLKLLQEELSAPQKVELITEMYKMMMVDRDVSKLEKAFISTVAQGIAISDEMHMQIYMQARGA